MARTYDPGRPPRALAVIVWCYLAWSLLPIALVVRASFTAGDSSTQLSGGSWQWYRAALDDDEYRGSLLQSIQLAVLTTVIVFPLGVSAALGLSRWRGRWGEAGRGLVLFAIAVPQLVLGGALFIVFTKVPSLRLGTTAQVLGHITLTLPFVIVVVWASLLSIGRDQEEGAMDLGATEGQALGRVVVPQVAPALLAGAVVAWVLSFDNLVISRWLCIRSDCATLPMQIYGRGAPRANPILYAYGSVGLAMTLTLATVAAPWLLRVVRRRAATGAA